MLIDQQTSSLVEPVVSAISTLVAAFAGAWFAFGLESRRQSRKSVAEDAISANLAIFSFIRTHNTFLNIKSQLIGDLESHPDRHHFIKPLMADSLKKLDLDYKSLAFLLGIDPNVLGEITVVEQDINGTIDLIRERSRLHYEQLQPAVERLHRAPNEEITIDEVETELGLRSTRQLVLSTNYMVDGVNRAIDTSKRAASDIRAAALKAHPKQKYIGIEE